jgi:DNA-binding GntR family transcriptional regulator
VAFGSLEPVQLQTAAAVIAERLRKAIGDGVFAAGEQLAENQLAQHFEVSRGPVREALNRLVQEGLIRNERHRGMFVIELDEDDIRDIYMARSAIERAAAELIVAHTERKLSHIGRLLNKMNISAAKDDLEALNILDLMFHMELVEASGSQRLKRMFETLIVETQICLRSLSARQLDSASLVDEHRSIFDAISQGDVGAASEAISKHMETAIGPLANHAL